MNVILSFQERTAWMKVHIEFDPLKKICFFFFYIFICLCLKCLIYWLIKLWKSFRWTKICFIIRLLSLGYIIIIVGRFEIGVPTYA